MVSRRELLGLGATAGALTVAGCGPLSDRLRARAPRESFELPSLPTNDGVRLFGRAGFGHRPGDLRDYERHGHAATVERLLRVDQPEAPFLVAQIAHLDVFRAHAAELEETPREIILRQLRQAAILRAVYGANPLLERMVDFWSDHFNVYGRKELGAWRLGNDIQTVIRPHALGRFPDMLAASARSPAMLGYLDNERNRKGAPNENYAREILELHTLGVDGGYTQRDIQEVARCFTGWTVEDRFLRPRGKFRFDPDRHERGGKTVLGQTIRSGGEDEGDAVVRIVAAHPATARHLARKLVRYFVGQRHASLEGEVAEAYRTTNGDIRAMLRPILLSKAFLVAPPMVKRPLDLVASALGALDGSTDAGPALQAHLSAMGQQPYEWPMPDGYPKETSAWSGSMLPRWQFAFALANDEIAGTRLEGRGLELEGKAAALYGRPPSEATMAAIRHGGLGVALASPEYQWR